MKHDLVKLLKSVLSELNIPGDGIEVEISGNPLHGEYTSNIAMKLAKVLKKSPMEIGLSVVNEVRRRITDDRADITDQSTGQSDQKISTSKNEYNVLRDIESIDVVAPGFINVKISESALISQIVRVLKEEEGYGLVKAKSQLSVASSRKKSKSASKNFNQATSHELPATGARRIMVEYTDPNPFKELHIGHLYSNAVGESLARLLESTGNEVKRADYFGDVGMHVSKTLWGLLKKMAEDKVSLSELAKLPLAERVHYLGQAYARGSQIYEDKSDEAKAAIEEMKDINYLVYVSAQDYMKKAYKWTPQVDYTQYIAGSKFKLADISALFETGRSWSLEYFESIYKRLGTRFDYYYPESITGEYGAKIVKENETVFEKSDGAVIFKGEKFGLHTRVFVNSLKLPTYEAKELGLAVKKYSDFPFDLCLNVTGNEINEYFKVVLCALSQIKPELASKIKHMGHGMVRLPQGKMSSRTGKVLTAEWLLDEVKQNVYDVLSKSETKYAKEVQEEIAEKATVAAIKYSFLKVALPSNIAFDLEKSVSFEGDSGPYLLYTYARCKSVLRKAGTGKQKTEDGGQNTEVLNPSSVVRLLSSSLNPEEHSLARLILLFPDVVSQAAEKFAPSILCTFLYDVAQAYNLFYAKHKILNPKSKIQNSKSNSNIKTELVITTEQSQFRLALTAASAQVLKNGLNLLGIATVERM